MARYLYGLSAADYLVSASGAPLPNTSVQVWDSRIAGSQIVDMLALDGSTPITVVTSDVYGFIGFYGPDNAYGDLWLDGGADRVAIRPANLASTISDLLVRVGVLETAAFVEAQEVPPSDVTHLWVDTGS